MVKTWSSTFLFPLVFLFVCMMGLLYPSFSFSFNWGVWVVEYEMDSFFLVDFLSMVFIFTVSLVSVSVLFYSISYMKNSIMKKKFIISLSLFIISMFTLVLGSDLFWVMVGWDGLGLTSLYLIMFFQSWKSFNSSMVTFILNRLGDSFLLLSLIWSLSIGLSKSVNDVSSLLYYSFLCVGALSKSAQFPFSAWLPLAMAAPTPVSALVHSSTLVTAGVFLMIRFYKFFHPWHMSMVFLLSSITILLAGISSLGEFDLKKIIALSTLSHIGMMMMFVSFGFLYPALVHLCTHAMFKSLLFMISGIIIHNNSGNQDIRVISMNFFDSLTGSSLIISLLSMIGIPFFSGFFSKEMFLMSSSSSTEFSLFTIFLFSASITSSYSMRIALSLFKEKTTSLTSFHFNCSDSLLFIIMSMMSLFMGTLIVWAVDLEAISTSFSLLFYKMKKELFMFVFFGLGVGFFISTVQGNCSSWTVNWSNMMWFIHSFTRFHQHMMFLTSFFFWSKWDSKGLLDHVYFSFNSSSKSLSLESLTLFVPSPLFLISFPLLMFTPLFLWL